MDGRRHWSEGEPGYRGERLRGEELLCGDRAAGLSQRDQHVSLA